MSQTQAQKDFIAYLVPGAQKGFTQYGVLASITIAQGCLESGWGTSHSARNDKNLFGIKMPGSKPEGMIIIQGSEATDGGYFRRYQSWDDSVLDHGFFLANNSRYSRIIGSKDYVFVANELQGVGYAGDTTEYTSGLIGTIKANNLTQYDSVGSGGAGGTNSYRSNNVSKFISIAEAQLGKPYVWGAAGPNSFDCSGLVTYIWNQLGLDIERTTYAQWPTLQKIDSSQLQAGDLLYQNFESNGPGHVGIYLGNGVVIAAPYTGVNVRKYSLKEFGSFSAARDPKMIKLLGGSSSTNPGESQLSIPTTNYEVVPDSITKSNDILYGRRCRVIVSSLDGEKALDVSQLRVTFNCIKTMQLEPQFSTIVIYNLSPKSENLIITEGFRVTIEAGYEGSQYGLIFDGNVVQPIRSKEDGTTYTLTLVAADADRWMSYSISNFSMVRGQNSRAIVENCASKASIPSQLGNISDSLSTSELTRGKAIFGLTRDYIRQIAQSENATAYIEGGKINIVKASDIPEGEIIDLTPESGLIGIPAQSDYGVTIKSLLNPRLKLDTLVHVDNELVRAQQFEQGQQVYALDHDGIYRIIQVTTIGDTRGNDWYTEVETVTQAGVLPTMVANGTQSPW